jgi:hypothetical protein
MKQSFSFSCCLRAELSRFRNPKKKLVAHESHRFLEQRVIGKRKLAQPLNQPSFYNKRERDIDTDEIFFHKYFQAKQATGKSLPNMQEEQKEDLAQEQQPEQEQDSDDFSYSDMDMDMDMDERGNEIADSDLDNEDALEQMLMQDEEIDEDLDAESAPPTSRAFADASDYEYLFENEEEVPSEHHPKQISWEQKRSKRPAAQEARKRARN